MPIMEPMFTMLPPRRVEHGLAERARHQEHAGRVDAQRFLPRGHRGIQALHRTQHGVVDQAVHAAELLEHLVAQGEHGPLVALVQRFAGDGETALDLRAGDFAAAGPGCARQ